MREVANLAARSAVANYSSRKLRRSVAITLPLSIISFVLAGLVYFLGGVGAKYFSLTIGTVMLGLIAMIELAHSFWKMKQLDASRISRASGAEVAADIEVADDVEPAGPPAEHVQ